MWHLRQAPQTIVILDDAHYHFACLAGLMALRERGVMSARERVAILLTGAER